MDVIQEKLFLYCRSENKDECIITLKDKLKKINQVEEYDLIYNNFVDTSSLGEYSQLSEIKDLNRPIHLMIFCQIYRHLLFPEHFSNFTSISEGRMEWLLSLFDKEYCSLSFVFVSGQLCNLYDNQSIQLNDDYHVQYYNNKELILSLKYPHSPEIDIPSFFLPKNRFCFPYILLHKASNLSFESMASLLVYDPRISKIPIGFKFYIDIKSGPHGGKYDTPQLFFDHDEDHFRSVIRNILYYNINDIWKLIKTIRLGTAFRKFIDVYIHMFLFENDPPYKSKSVNVNIFDNFNKYSLNLVNNFDQYDQGYVIKYLMSANDINDNELIERYFQYEYEYKILRDELLDTGKNSSFDRNSRINIISTDFLQLYLTRLNII